MLKEDPVNIGMLNVEHTESPLPNPDKPKTAQIPITL